MQIGFFLPVCEILITGLRFCACVVGTTHVVWWWLTVSVVFWGAYIIFMNDIYTEKTFFAWKQRFVKVKINACCHWSSFDEMYCV